MGELVQFIPHQVNGVKVDQRSTDGFINVTAMCAAHGKEVSDWLRLESTFQLFCALASFLGIKTNMAFCRDSGTARLSATKYGQIFSSLIFVKRGSPENGGGIWLHYNLAIQLAQWCNPAFAIQVSCWVHDWLTTGKNPVYVESDLEKEAVLWQQRYDIRVFLKDFLRPELMNAVVAYALRNSLSPIKLCAEVHDTMNERIQGMKSKQIKALNGLPLGELLRDYFDVDPLVAYASINRLAKNCIKDSNIEPIKAVHEACDMYLGAAYEPKPLKLSENVYVQGYKIQEARKRKSLSQYHQLSLFPNDKAI